ncbi:SDR family oxidoreductase [Cyberlindnera jadinii NRRL Y-1542]|uniref:Dihydrokaempferol 4-reductase n=1 Tax=Cyberlindnera jadinii (strain ATCC 18201 / CBS 1600 / BCRC 20928 / JCM 3617 / NBRC 0987 / NRRL Y-1542) TaxID=983966 RepID=A0A1E4S2D2_CYBJN|nr:dihydrokaempferol 4-reductase [Cyberlindnera jadinii NRRL Y-1542]ODV73676.1 dihydrokaempferol 4-reductase [Cyberlindnera jadinii NRRL Y-1542]
MAPVTVLITGASGFIALHVIDELLRKGYRVIGTVRSQSKADKITAQFKKVYPDGDLSFELVEDIAAEGAFNDVFKKHPEITEVLHTASPFSFGLNKSFEDAYLTPATKGTQHVLEAIKEYAPQVKHVVVTSSFAAIANRSKSGDKSFIHTEDTWNPIEWSDVDDQYKAYTASKKCAEVLARKFVEAEKPNFTLTTVNPPYVLGPQLFEDALENPTLNTSAEIVHQLLSTPADYAEYLSAPVGLSVDVRDVAKLHVLPIEKDSLAGLRLFPVNGAFNGQTLLNIIHNSFPELDGKVGKGKPEGAEEQVAKTQAYYDTTKTQQATGLTWIPLEKTVKDSVAQILSYKAHKL